MVNLDERRKREALLDFDTREQVQTLLEKANPEVLVSLNRGEIKMAIRGLELCINSYCATKREEAPYHDLINKLTEKLSEIKRSRKNE